MQLQKRSSTLLSVFLINFPPPSAQLLFLDDERFIFARLDFPQTVLELQVYYFLSVYEIFNPTSNVFQLRVYDLIEAAALHSRYAIAHHNKYETENEQLDQPTRAREDRSEDNMKKC